MKISKNYLDLMIYYHKVNFNNNAMPNTEEYNKLIYELFKYLGIKSLIYTSVKQLNHKNLK